MSEHLLLRETETPQPVEDGIGATLSVELEPEGRRESALFGGRRRRCCLLLLVLLRTQSPTPLSRVVDEQLRLSSVARHHLRRLVTGLLHDRRERFAGLHRGGHQARSKAVARVVGRVDPGLHRRALHRERDGAVGEPISADETVLAHAAEERAGGLDASGLQSFQPGPYGANRTRDLVTPRGHADRASCAFLVGLGALEDHPQAFVVEGHVLHVDRHQLAQAKPSRSSARSRSTAVAGRSLLPWADRMADRSSFGRIGLAWRWAVPRVRRMPLRVSFTSSFLRGDG